jgi:C1A family cysteine protease
MNNLLLTLFILLSLLFYKEAHAKNYGLIQPSDWQERAEFLELKSGVNLPEEFDWRVKLGKAPAVLNQGNCGSCWAFSRVMTLTWQHLIKGDTVTPAPQELVSCDREQYGCAGGFWDDYELNGISLESDFRYTAKNSHCKSDLPRQYKIAKWMYLGSPGKKPTVEEMKQVIYQIGPIGVTIAVVGRFPQGCRNGRTNHMVVVTGWTKKGEWIMQNSWGKSWNGNGYANIKYGCFNIGETAAVSILP